MNASENVNLTASRTADQAPSEELVMVSLTVPVAMPS